MFFQNLFLNIFIFMISNLPVLKIVTKFLLKFCWKFQEKLSEKIFMIIFSLYKNHLLRVFSKACLQNLKTLWNSKIEI